VPKLSYPVTKLTSDFSQGDLMTPRIRFSLIGFSLFLASTAWSQTLPAAARQALMLPPGIATVAIWPPEFIGEDLSQSLVNSVSDQVEQALSRKANELRLKVISRRQIDTVVRELNLSSSDSSSFDAVAKSRSIDAVLVSTVSLVRADCLSISIKTLGTAEQVRSQILNGSKPFRVGILDDDLDFDGCEAVERPSKRASVSRRSEQKLSEVAVAMPLGPAAKASPPSTPNASIQFANRKALVIGNDSYKSIPKLANARADAKAIAEGLSKVGYAVTLKTDLTEKEMKSVLRTFKLQVEAGDEVAIFYAGHGVQLENSNYLIPIDVAGDAAEQVKDEAIPLQRILDDMAERKAKLTLAVVDACRDNPFKTAGRSIGQGRGLAPTTAATGQMVVFSAGTGQQALDNLGPADKEKNGIFTRVFIRELSKPDRTVDAVVKQVRNEVVKIAKSVGHDQVPAIYDQVVGDFYFARSAQ
jgi:hypothetical protein